MTTPGDPAILPAAHVPAEAASSEAASFEAIESHLTVRGLRCSYRGRAAFHDLDLDLPRGRITALIGPSGCGKSSFLQTLNRLTDLIPGCRVTGSATFDGVEIHDERTDPVALRRRIGMIFQKPSPFPLSIRRNLEIPLREHGLVAPGKAGAADLADRIEACLRDVGLWHEVGARLDDAATDLSGGQQQRLCLARALALQPEVLLLDEPCSHLDPVSSGVVEDLVASLRGDLTVLIVTHNLAQARRLADRVAFFWVVDGVGRLIEKGPTRRIFEAPEDPLTRAYVGGHRG